ncbi:MAG: putative metal-binding motif-containing protein [Deltaproteobacteria bacterium]|nr:putative metal-binding motif-containing protein [Deltaproteobacteria bacterium]
MIALLLLLACGVVDDLDGDGFSAGVDCDDADPHRYPDAPARCDGLDDDCDGLIDEDPVEGSLWFPDRDRDGHGAAGQGALSCSPPIGAVAIGDDCDDEDADNRPTAYELCDGEDNDCDGLIDESGGGLWYADRDGDGWGAGPLVAGCGGAGLAEARGDCDDQDATSFPGAPEACDGADNDCDGGVDEDPAIGPLWYPDRDGDGAAGVEGAAVACEAPVGWLSEATDCVDTDSRVWPGAPELCDGVDNDCDGEVDGADAWWDPRWPVRVRVRLTGPSEGPVVAVPLDLSAALGVPPEAVERWGLRALAGGCDAVVLPSQWSDAVVGLPDGPVAEDPAGDGRGEVVLLWETDGDPESWEPLGSEEIALYWRPHASSWQGDGALNAAPLRLDTGASSLSLGADGALLALSGWGAEARDGVYAGGWLARSEASVQVLADGPLLGVLRSEERLGGAVDERSWWWGVADRPQRWGQRSLVATAPLGLDLAQGPLEGIRPWALEVGTAALIAEDPAGEWAVVGEGALRLGAGWIQPPSWAHPLGLSAGSLALVGQDVAPYGTHSGAISAGDALLDPVVAAFVPGGEEVEARLLSLRQGVQVTVLPPEWLAP